jgi:hypothetical protein
VTVEYPQKSFNRRVGYASLYAAFAPAGRVDDR